MAASVSFSCPHTKDSHIKLSVDAARLHEVFVRYADAHCIYAKRTPSAILESNSARWLAEAVCISIEPLGKDYRVNGSESHKMNLLVELIRSRPGEPSLQQHASYGNVASSKAVLPETKFLNSQMKLFRETTSAMCPAISLMEHVLRVEPAEIFGQQRLARRAQVPDYKQLPFEISLYILEFLRVWFPPCDNRADIPRALLGHFSRDCERKKYLIFRSLSIAFMMTDKFFVLCKSDPLYRFISKHVRALRLGFESIFAPKVIARSKTLFPRLRSIELVHFNFSNPSNGIPLEEDDYLRLKIVDLKTTTDSTDRALQVFPHLKRLVTDRISDSSMRLLMKTNIKQLVTLRWSNEEVMNLVSLQPGNIETLDIWCFPSPPHPLASVPLIHSLRSLEMRNRTVESLHGISSLQFLRTFSFSYGDFGVDNRCFAELLNCQHLSTLIMNGHGRLCPEILDVLGTLVSRGQLEQLEFSFDMQYPPFTVDDNTILKLDLDHPDSRVRIFSLHGSQGQLSELALLSLFRATSVRSFYLGNAVLDAHTQRIYDFVQSSGLYENESQ